ncbi:translation initiation factor IF-2 N-terminal domain-containing protein [Skermania piniformis]|uniref:Translation initiation factor IF-2 N-terminal domain-containing protein n=2 Tax=Skermania pinensis TaxID=39122 RepID=A0ABX8SD22_9ACTN|nr:translation initiation factor IF-2 N-terminal domain-containing protein [Skermania piniformis]
MPDRIRVHALAKRLGVTSKRILAQLSAFGSDVRSPSSSLDRVVAESVRDALAEPVESAPEPAPVPDQEAAPPSVVAVQLFTSPAAEPQPEPAVYPVPEVVAAPVFLQPDMAAAEETRRSRRAERQARAARAAAEAEAPEVATGADTGRGERVDSVDDGSDPVKSDPVESDPVQSDIDEPDERVDTDDLDQGPLDDGDDADPDGRNAPRRRRRGRRGRGRGRGEKDRAGDGDTEVAGADLEADQTESAEPAGDDAAVEADEAEPEEAQADEAEPEEDGGDGATRRRRRRRRRRGSGSETAEESGAEDDPPNTVVHEREPRNKGRANRTAAASDEVQGISGSTRLEAKRQRRRDGRDAGRRRPPILSEAEFLARREAVERVMVVREKSFAGTDPHAPVAPITQVAVLEDKVLVEHFVTSTGQASMVGNVYLGRVQNVLPSMEAAFVDIGRGRNGVLYAGEVNWEAAGLGGKERKIEQALRPGDQVLVQVSKDPIGHKGARLTTQISLAGRFLVYVPGGTSTGISRKLPDTERKRLKEILREIVPADAGVIIRTASEGVSEAELTRDVERLQERWATISEAAAAAGKGNPKTLYEEPDLLVKVVRDLFNEDFAKLVIEGEQAWVTVESYVRGVAPDMLDRLERYTSAGELDVFGAHRIDEQLAKALDRKVWLPSGGTLVIDRTEAMTVVDVNTGKFTGAGGNLEETVTRNNLEAAEEIVRQMRLRDIGGMIVVDFIDMVLESNRALVLRRLTECLGRDRTRHQVSEVTSLGLVQMTRKKLGTGLVEAFSTTCEHCHGRGIVVHSYPVESGGEESSGRAAGRAESGGRRRRGRDRSAAAEPPPPVAATDVDASVKRAHPVALAMAAGHELPDGVVPEDVVLEDVVSDGDPIRPAAVATDNAGFDTDASDTGDGGVEVPDVAATEPADTAEPVVTDSVTATGSMAAETPQRSGRRRRVSRSAAAPTAANGAGTVFVVSADAPPPRPILVEIDAEPVLARRPRRRAAGRPAGPPVDVQT